MGLTDCWPQAIDGDYQLHIGRMHIKGIAFINRQVRLSLYFQPQRNIFYVAQLLCQKAAATARSDNIIQNISGMRL